MSVEDATYETLRQIKRAQKRLTPAAERGKTGLVKRVKKEVDDFKKAQKAERRRRR